MRLHPIILLSFIISACVANKAEEGIGELHHTISKKFSHQKGVFAMAFKDLSSGEELLINEHEKFHAASTMKTPVLIEAYKQAAEGKFSLSDSLLIKNDFKSIVDNSSFSITDDSENTLYTLIGQKRPLSELLYKMIINSSNLATNLIIEYVDAKNVNKTMREMGAEHIQVLRGVEDLNAYEKGLNNSTTAYDLMIIYSKLANGEAVSREASQEMINILLDQQDRKVIPAKLPAGVKVAHKTGFITGVRHDSGIVLLPDGRKYVLVLLSKSIEDEEAVISMLSDISLLIYNFVASDNLVLQINKMPTQ